MAHVSGSLVTANTGNNQLAVISAVCYYAEVDIEVLNPTGADMAVEIAVSPTGSASPNADDYIEKGGIVAASGGKIEHTSKRVKPGSIIFIKSSAVGLIAQVRGKTITKPNS